MQTGLTDASFGLEIYVCGLSLRGPPTPLLFFPFLVLCLTSSFLLFEITRERNGDLEKRVKCTISRVFYFMSRTLFLIPLPSPSLLASVLCPQVSDLAVTRFSSKKWKPPLPNPPFSPQYRPLHFFPRSDSPLPPPPASLLCSPYARMAPPLKSGK